MNDYVFSLILFIVIYLFYLIFVIARPKKREKFKKNSYIKLLEQKYNLDLKNVNYKSLLHAIALSNSFIMTSSFYVFSLIERYVNWFLGFGAAIIVLIILELVMYKLIGTLYGKKEV